MKRLVPILCVVCAVGIGLTAWSRLAAGSLPDAPSGPATPAATAATDPARRALHEARRRCSIEALDAVVARLDAAARAAPEDAVAWRLLAEAHLERAQQRTHLRGLAVGEPLFSDLPQELAADLEKGLAAVQRARELGDDSGALFRIEASLMSQHITGFGAALQWNARVADALAKAAERAAEDPYLHTALGLRKLLAPRWFGHDPEAALEHFAFAAEASDDERPAVFAGMASYLQKKRQQAIAWLERAVERNPDNVFARVVLRRLVRGEDDPFGRDVTAAEIAAAK